MQLPDENIEYDYRRLVAPPPDPWTPLTELQAQNYVPPDRLDALKKPAEMVRGQITAERGMSNVPLKLQPLQTGFIDLPQNLLDALRRKGDASELGRINRLATRMRENCDRVVVLGIGGSYLGARALFDALCHTYHNEMPAKLRMGKPRFYFEGNALDNDTLQEFFEL